MIDIGGIPVDANTAADWVSKGLLDTKHLGGAASVVF